MSVSGGTTNIHFHHANNHTRDAPVRVLPFSRNEDVVIRPSIFSQLGELLPASEARSAALWGLGGSGKTQVALEFAYQRAEDDRNCSIFWVHADTEATFTQDFTLIARKAGLSALDGEELLKAVCHFIESQPRWLLVLDNADDLRLFGVGVAHENAASNSTIQSAPKSLYSYIPKGPSGSTLWTSRDQRIVGSLVGSLRAIQVTSMLPKEAQSLLATVRGRALSDEEIDDAVALLSELQHIPLPVSQAAAYIRRTATPVNKYLSRLKDGKKRWALLKRTNFDRHRREGISNSILETWNITIEHLREKDETAVKILYILAYMDNQNISGEIVKAAAEAAANLPSIPDDNDNATEEAVTRLREFSFLHTTVTSDGEPIYDMHQLVQEATLYNHSVWDAGHSMRYPEVAIRILTQLFPNSERENWARCEKYVPHITRASKWAEVANAELVASDLLVQASAYLDDACRWIEKETFDNSAYLLREKILGRVHPRTIICLSNLVETYHSQGRYNEAEKIGIEVLALHQKALGRRNPQTIKSMVNLATTYHSQGRYNEAEKAFIEVLALCREILGKQHPGTIASMSDLATTYRAQGRYNEAEKAFVEVLALSREILGKRHPKTIGSMSDLAITYHAQGRYNKAERRLLEEAVKLQREILGKRHPKTILSMSSLAAIHMEQGRYGEAENTWKTVLQLQQDVLGKKHPEALNTMHRLAWCWRRQRRNSKALELMRDCYQLQRDVLGPTHPSSKRTKRDLGSWNHAKWRMRW
ncbi:TPR-like protein [Colletotrichum eremochloae]|nr:TPR-like protein [Colletotrichum eremochloae]